MVGFSLLQFFAMMSVSLAIGNLLSIDSRTPVLYFRQYCSKPYSPMEMDPDFSSGGMDSRTEPSLMATGFALQKKIITI